MTQQTDQDGADSGGTYIPGDNGEYRDIVGKRQADLTAEDLDSEAPAGDGSSDLPAAET